MDLAQSAPRLRFRRFRGYRTGRWLAIVSGAVLLGMVLLAIIGPIFAKDPASQDLAARLQPPAFAGGDAEYLLGTDHLGRDILSRLANGARISLIVASASLALSAVIGIVIGIIAGFYRGIVDDVVMRAVDAQLAIPYVLLAITLVALLHPSLGSVVIALLLYGWVIYARLVRAEVLSLREQEFILATRSMGASDWRIILSHLLPNITTPLIVISTLELANLVIIEAALGFLGLGIPPPTATWGGMVADGRTYLTTGVWWLSVIPGGAIMLTILAVNILGDWLRDRLDPRLVT
jgi:peptide/nickel transport system permease protein